MVLTGDALLVGDAGRPDLHAHGEHTRRGDGPHALPLADRAAADACPTTSLLYPAHYSGSVCGRGLSANPASTIGFERRHNRALQLDSEDAFVEALVAGHPAGAGAAGRDRRRQPHRRDAARRSERLTRRASGSGCARTLPQFSLLVAVNAFVGAMVGLERSTLPLIGEEDFGLASSAAVLSFIVAFGLAKSFTNLARRRRSPSASGGGGC